MRQKEFGHRSTSTTSTILDFRDDHTLKDNDILDQATYISSHTSVTKIDVFQAWITDARAAALALALGHTTTVTDVNFGNNFIGDRGACAIAAALAHMTGSASSLIKSSGENGHQAPAHVGSPTNKPPACHIGDLAGLHLHVGINRIGDDGARAIAAALPLSSTLTTLNLSYNRIRGSAVKALAGALRINHSLQTLLLKYTMMGDDGAAALAAALVPPQVADDTGETRVTCTPCVALTTLCVGGCQIGNVGAAAFGVTLASNTTLMTLEMDANVIGSQGACALSAGLMHNDNLTSLNVGGNPIGSSGMQALAVALAHNARMQSLYAYNANVGREGPVPVVALSSVMVMASCGTRIAETIALSPTLRTLCLTGNPLGPDVRQQMLACAMPYSTTLFRLELAHCGSGTEQQPTHVDDEEAEERREKYIAKRIRRAARQNELRAALVNRVVPLLPPSKDVFDVVRQHIPREVAIEVMYTHLVIETTYQADSPFRRRDGIVLVIPLDIYFVMVKMYGLSTFDAKRDEQTRAEVRRFLNRVLLKRLPSLNV